MIKLLISIAIILLTEMVCKGDTNTTSTEPESDDYEHQGTDPPEEDDFDDDVIFQTNFSDRDMGQLASTDGCYNHFKVSRYEDDDVADAPESSANGIGMVVMDDGCCATPMLNLSKGTYFTISSKTLSAAGGKVTVWQDSASQTYSGQHAAGCWDLDDGELQPGIGRVYFKFEFNSQTNPAEYAFVVDNIEIRGTLLEYKPPKPPKQPRELTMVDLRMTIMYILIPVVSIMALLILYAFVYYTA